jgi:SOS response regulatory protein OraA/RecX
MPRITSLDERPRDRVRVDLDGEPWRELPAGAVVRAGLAVGLELDRPALRLLRRELRRSEALARAVRALRHDDLPAAALRARLDRAAVAPAAREDALAALAAAGLVDDGRFASGRADALARRGWGDAAIRADLERRGVGAELVTAALAALPNEVERARPIVRKRGGPPARTARFLAGRGFSAETLEAVLTVEIADEP